MTSWTVRPPTADDADRVAEINVSSWRAAYTGILPQQLLDDLEVGPRAERLRERYRTGDSANGYVVADAAERVVGYTWFGPHRDTEHRAANPGAGWGEIYAIYVDPQEFGRGAGRALMGAALADLAPAPVVVWVLTDNHLARAFYERCGFRPDGATQTYAPGRLDVPELRYALTR